MSHKILVTKTLRWHLRTKGAKEAFRPEPVRTFVLNLASLHLQQDSRMELSESAKLCHID